jgi:hypothetical protein
VALTTNLKTLGSTRNIYRHFQNGRHNTAQIQHCPISTIYYIECMKIEDTNGVIKGQTMAK